MKILFVLSIVTIVLAVWRIIRTFSDKNTNGGIRNKNRKIEMFASGICLIINLVNVFGYLTKYSEEYLAILSLNMYIFAILMFTYTITAYAMFGEFDIE